MSAALMAQARPADDGPAAMAMRPPAFRSFIMAGFEGSALRRPDGTQLDLIAATRHDAEAASDYATVAAAGLRTVRDALRWHRIEAEPGRYDWSSVLPMMQAAREAGVQVVWDMCHYGVPAGLDVFDPAFLDRFGDYCAAFARLLRDESGDAPLVCPVNEVSYWAWAGGDHARMYPNAIGRGPALKRQLAAASIRAIDAIRAEHPGARFIQAEPLIHVAANPDMPETEAGAASHHESQFEAFDMIAGRMAPELGGSEAHLDLIGVNFYPDNQILRGGGTVPMGHWLYRPFRDMLAGIARRYGRPLLISETGAEGPNGPGWLRYVCGEVRAAMRAGVPIEGVCIYPIMDYPGWKDGRHCRCGLIRASSDWRQRQLDTDLLRQIDEERMLFDLAATAGP